MSPTNRSMDVPSAHEQLLRDLTVAIDQGRYAPGDQLPTVRDLADEYGVSPSTARKAVEALQRMGLAFSGYVDGKRGVRVASTGRTNFFATDALRPGRPGAGSDTFTENALKTGRNPSKRFAMVMRVPPARIATRLGLEKNEIAVERTTIQLLDSQPWSRERSWYQVAFAAETGIDSPDDIDQGTIRYLESRGYKETAHRDEVMDSAATQEDSSDLGVMLGSPLLVQTRTAATGERITRVTETVRLGGRNRLIWETGTDAGLAVIRSLPIPDDEYAD